MNIQKAIERLRKQAESINLAVEVLENLTKQDRSKRKSIVKYVRRKKLHWTQRPENKKRIRAHLNKINKIRNSR